MVSRGATGSANILLQTVTTTHGVFQTGFLIPTDGTIPQSGEGLEIVTLSITPFHASNILEVIYTVPVHNELSSNPVIALFRDAGVDAVAAIISGGLQISTIACGTLIYRVIAGSIAATTFKIRLGTDWAGRTVTCAGIGGVASLGAVMIGRLIINEYQV